MYAIRSYYGAKIVVGGYHATLMTQEITKSPEGKLIDFIIQGEGDTAFKRLVEARITSYNVCYTKLLRPWGQRLFHISR